MTTTHLTRFFTVMFVVLAVGLFVGCSSDGGEEAATTEEAVATEEPAVAEDQAKEVAEALLAYANPKTGMCPVCDMKVEVAQIKEAKIEDKKYACCSASCVAKLTEDPDKYLVAKTGHEGHGH